MNKTIAQRDQADSIKNLLIEIDDRACHFHVKEPLQGSYNTMYLFDDGLNQEKYEGEVFGKLMASEVIENVTLNENSNVSCNGASVDFNLNKTVNIRVRVFIDKPERTFPFLAALPIPFETITIWIECLNSEIIESTDLIRVAKKFDTFSHLGFILVDFDRMKSIVAENYSASNINLIEEFSCDEIDIVTKLFAEEILVVVWGINPYTYPIYSTSNIASIEPIIGEKLPEQGVYNLRESIKELILIPGDELQNWENCLNKKFSTIKLEGRGKKTYVQPYCNRDSDGDIVNSSFVIYRDSDSTAEMSPLLNIDMLYQ